MNIHNKTEKQYMNDIYSKYSQLINESSSDRRQTYFAQFIDYVFRWSIAYYYYKSTYTFATEIMQVLQRLNDNEKSSRSFETQDSFFRYLKVSLKMAKLENIRKREDNIIHIPREKLEKLKEMENAIRMEELELVRKLSPYEKETKVSEWFGITTTEARYYLEEIKSLKGSSGKITTKTTSNKKAESKFDKNDFGYNDGEHDYNHEGYDNQNDPQKRKDHSNDDREKDDRNVPLEIQKKMVNTKKALEEAFSSRQVKNNMPFYRALFTAYFLNRAYEVDLLSARYNWMDDYLDKDILETEKKPTNREIFLKYFPGEKDPDQKVTRRLNDFLKKINPAYEELKRTRKEPVS